VRPSVLRFLIVSILLFSLLTVLVNIQGVNASSTVGTSTDEYATSYPFQRKVFYANGRFWDFYSDGINMVYRTSTDGTSWSAATTVRADSFGQLFSIWFDGTYLHYAYFDVSAIYYRRGTPNVNGSITWSASEQTVSTTSNSAEFPFVSVDSNGYVWIGFVESNHPWVIKSGNNDGTWGTTPNGFPYQLSTTSGTWCVSVIPLTAGKMLAIYAHGSGYTVTAQRWDGAAWGTEVETTYTAFYGYYYSAVAQGDNVHLTFLRGTEHYIVYYKYTYTSNSFGTEVIIKTYAEAYSAPVLCRDTSTNYLYVFWATKTTGEPSGATANHIYYQKSIDGGASWSAMVDWINEATEVLTYADRLTCFYQSYGNYTGLMYMTKTSSPYNVKFAYLSANIAPTNDALTLDLTGLDVLVMYIKPV